MCIGHGFSENGNKKKKENRNYPILAYDPGLTVFFQIYLTPPVVVRYRVRYVKGSAPFPVGQLGVPCQLLDPCQLLGLG